MTLKSGGNTGKGFDLLGSLLSKAFEFLGAGGLVLAQLRNAAERRAEAMAARVGLRLLLYLWVSAGLFLTLLGLLDFLVDQGEVPRGMAWGGGGALISLVSLLLLHSAKKRMADPR